LLDEPGLSLHAAAQADLLRFIDNELAPNYQVIYTTHSPFMIDSLKLNEVRTVYDNSNKETGSVISDALDEKDSDTLFPLQAALGYSLAQNLFKIIQDKKIVFYHDVMKTKHADVEDLFNQDEYIKIYNKAFNRAVDINSLDVNLPIMKQLKGLNGDKSFNHYTPANYLATNIGDLKFSNETLNQFEELFKLVNKKM